MYFIAFYSVIIPFGTLYAIGGMILLYISEKVIISIKDLFQKLKFKINILILSIHY